MKGKCNRPGAAAKILLAFAALAWAGAAAAQTAEEIIAKNLEAIGGMKNIEKLKTFTRKGEANLDGQFGQLQGTTELKVVVGQKVYQGLDLNVFYRISVWLGGDSGWQDDTMNGLQDVSGEKLSLSKNQSQINPFITYKKDGVKATKLDDEKVAKVSLSPAAPAAPAGGAAPASGGAAAQPAAAPAAPPAEMVDCHVLQMENPSGNKVKIYIDKKTNLILQMRFQQSDDQFGDVQVIVENAEYEEHNGVKFVKELKMQTGEVFTMDMKFTETQVNEPIDDKVFEKPKPPAPPAGAAPAAPAAPATK